uniref:Sodium/nucleoside cotransporter n=1 Tax=Saccoglossus kowalevskii TaxID=10224 RepID=A0ABM0GPI2_SACKO|nr:PREDICTED: solute carrier family 28 member 3-like [Saccoglossus kowalevskii]
MSRYDLDDHRGMVRPRGYYYTRPNPPMGLSNPGLKDVPDIQVAPVENNEYHDIELDNLKKNRRTSTGIQADIPVIEPLVHGVAPYANETVAIDISKGTEEDNDDCCTKCMNNVGDQLGLFYEEYQRYIWYGIYVALIVGYFAYLIYACYYDFQQALPLVVITALVLLFILYVLLRDNFGEACNTACIKPFLAFLDSKWYFLRWFVYIGLLAVLVVFLVVYGKDNPEQLISALGLLVLVAFCFVFSKAPMKVKWRPVLWGLALQFILGIFILRTKAGYESFKWIGDKVQIFLEFTNVGSKFLFGDLYENHFFAFKVLPVVIFFSCCISICYYFGIMQFVISKISWIMQVTMHTSATESLNAAGNIFIGQTEAPLLIKPFLKDMTKSELHAVMTGGFATIAGGVLGAYIAFGISSSHLLSASVMSAPAALAISKLFYPEIEHSEYMTQEQVLRKMDLTKERNAIEAASNGASTAVSLVANIGANLIAFIALLAFTNALLGWFGGMVGIPELTFELICSYVFMPLAWLMGTPWEDCHIVAELIGIKTFINEFVAYLRLAEILENRETGDGPTISRRAEVISTYALCGFANVGSIGIQLGGITPMCPSRKGDLAEIAIRALVAGTVACFMTACVAGVLYKDFDETYDAMLVNSTLSSIINNTTTIGL